MNASVLLLLLFNSKSGVGNYPAKIFEYLATKTSILAFGPSGSDTEKLISKTNSGIFFTYENEHLKNEILALFDNKNQFKFDNIEGFSREKLTEDLSNVLKSIH